MSADRITEFTSPLNRFLNQPIHPREALKRMALIGIGATASAMALKAKPAEAQEYRFEYSAKQDRISVVSPEDGMRWAINPSHDIWPFGNWGALDKRTADKWGITRWFEPNIGYLASYAKVHEAITGSRSNVVEQAADMADSVLTSAPKGWQYWGNCHAVAIAQELEKVPVRWFGSTLYNVPVDLDHQKGILSASHSYPGAFREVGEPGIEETDEQKQQNVDLMLKRYMEGKPVIAEVPITEDAPGDWFRAVNGVREDLKMVSVSKLGQAPHDVPRSAIRYAYIPFHPQGADADQYDKKWTTEAASYRLTEMRLDIVRHICFGTPLV